MIHSSSASRGSILVRRAAVPLCSKLLHDGTQPIGRLGMPGPHVMLEIARIVDETGFPMAESRET